MMVKSENQRDRHVFIYKLLHQRRKPYEGCNGYMGSFYFMDKWYSVIKYFMDHRNALGYYININKPPRMENGIITIEDLFLDIWVAPDYSYSLLDVDELEMARQQGIIDHCLYTKVLETSKEVIDLIKGRKIPDEFMVNYTID